MIARPFRARSPLCQGLLALLAVIACIAMPALAQTPSAGAPEPAQRIEAFHEALAGLADLENGPTRRARLAPLVETLFDMPLIARLSLGLRWRELPAADQEAFITALRAVVVATYSARFAKPSTAQFELLETVPGRRGAIVRSRIVRSDGSAVPLDYHFRNGKIYNVVADGVSDLSLRRADYSGVLKQEGYAALRSHMDAQRLALEKEDDESE